MKIYEVMKKTCISLFENKRSVMMKITTFRGDFTQTWVSNSWANLNIYVYRGWMIGSIPGPPLFPLSVLIIFNEKHAIRMRSLL